MPSPHTADNVLQVVQEVLSEWDILPWKVQAILTDSGSNMVAAFKQVCSEGDEDEDVDRNESLSVSGSSDDEDASEIQNDIEDVERKELDHDVVFSLLFQHNSCFSHMLQLVVCKFNEI